MDHVLVHARDAAQSDSQPRVPEPRAERIRPHCQSDKAVHRTTIWNIHLRAASIYLGDKMPPLHWSLIVVALPVVARRQFHLFAWNLSMRNHAQQMRNAVEPCLFFVVGSNDMPGSMLAIGRLQHQGPRIGILIPATERLSVHWTELPLPERIVDPCFESSRLLVGADFEPILEEHDPAIDYVLLRIGTALEEDTMLLLRTEAHHILHSGAVVPTA